MAWSTRQLAELAGTTVKAVRHYHKLGLLDEPERHANGYKQYEVPHLVRLLQISRLADLGIPLAEIGAMDRADHEPEKAIRVLDAQLAATIERLQRVREELAVVLRYGSPAELPAGFGPVADEMSEADRSVVMVYSRLLDPSALDDVRQMIEDAPREPADEEFESLSPDADRATRRRLGEALAPTLGRHRDEFPWLNDPSSRSARGAALTDSTMAQVIAQLYSLAQREVLYRAHLIASGNTDAMAELEAVLDAKESAALGTAEPPGPAAD